jgi:hypothetical protein
MEDYEQKKQQKSTFCWGYCQALLQCCIHWKGEPFYHIVQLDHKDQGQCPEGNWSPGD